MNNFDNVKKLIDEIKEDESKIIRQGDEIIGYWINPEDLAQAQNVIFANPYFRQNGTRVQTRLNGYPLYANEMIKKGSKPIPILKNSLFGFNKSKNFFY